MNRYLWSTILLVSVGACASTPESTACMTPAGTYYNAFVPQKGTCSDEFNNAIATKLSADSQETSIACYDKNVSGASSFTKTGGATCSLALAGNSKGTSSGYSTTFTVTVSCTDNDKCTEDFTVTSTKK